MSELKAAVAAAPRGAVESRGIVGLLLAMLVLLLLLAEFCAAWLGSGNSAVLSQMHSNASVWVAAAPNVCFH